MSIAVAVSPLRFAPMVPFREDKPRNPQYMAGPEHGNNEAHGNGRRSEWTRRFHN